MINLLTLQVKLSDPSDGNIKGLKFIQDINLVASKDEYNCNLSPGYTGHTTQHNLFHLKIKLYLSMLEV